MFKNCSISKDLVLPFTPSKLRLFGQENSNVFREICMNRNNRCLVRTFRKLAVLTIVVAGTTVASRLGATNTSLVDCTPTMNTCAGGCPSPVSDPSGYSQCVAQCVSGGVGCQNGGGDLDCGSVYSLCGGTQGTDVGSCYGDFFSCGANGFQRGYAMIQSPPPDDHPCFTQANDDYFLCVDPENLESPCSNLTGVPRAHCCGGIRDMQKTACLGL